MIWRDAPLLSLAKLFEGVCVPPRLRVPDFHVHDDKYTIKKKKLE